MPCEEFKLLTQSPRSDIQNHTFSCIKIKKIGTIQPAYHHEAQLIHCTDSFLFYTLKGI